MGSAFSLERPSKQFPNLIGIPTMRIPGRVDGTLNAYLAMRAILVEFLKLRHSSIALKSIAIPSLCTGVRGFNYHEAAEQMLPAYKNIVLGGWRNIVYPAMAPYTSRVKHAENPNS